MARPTKRTPEREKRLFDALRAGNTVRAASVYAGVDERTVERWQARNVGFAASVTRAIADSEVGLVANIRQHGQADWRANAWLLERRFPETWGRREPETLGPAVNVQIVERQVLVQQVAGALEEYPDARDNVLSLLQRNGHAES